MPLSSPRIWRGERDGIGIIKVGGRGEVLMRPHILLCVTADQ